MFAANDTLSGLFQERLANTIDPLQKALMNHAVYRRLSLQPDAANGNGTNRSGEYRLGSPAARSAELGWGPAAHAAVDPLTPLRTFMESHVFAVWDFMSLVKTLQQRLTCVRTPWHPPADPLSARLINEIVLVEETDEVEKGQYASHFDLYLTAMEEVGANTQPMRTFLAALREGRSITAAMARTDIQSSTKAFVMNTMESICGETHEVAASFLLGRESVIPLMFEQMLGTTAKLEAPTFTWYLKRHIEVDGDEHGPAGWRLLTRLCGSNAMRWCEAEASAKRALYSRKALWDGVVEALEQRQRPPVAHVG
jgi:Protein of unknown function (DUF3050)